MRLAIIAEKPFHFRHLAQLLPEYFPDVDFKQTPICFPVFDWYVGETSRFVLPHDLGYASLPMVGPPSYRRVTFERSRGCVGLKELGGEARSVSEEDAARYYANADVILALMDPNASSAHLAERVITDLIGFVPEGRILYPWIDSFSEINLRNSLRDMKAFEDHAARYSTMGRIKRFFDFNYLANSTPFFGAAARASGLPLSVSKFGLQALYHAKDSGPLSDGTRLAQMSRWKGSGRYQASNYYGLGSPSSRPAILKQLEQSGYLERTGVGRTGERGSGRTQISPAGELFLSLLHPDCRDPDLPFRIDDWMSLSEPEAQEKICRYIRTYFGKQKRFMGKWERFKAAQ
jgi:hypothetical protein